MRVVKLAVLGFVVTLSTVGTAVAQDASGDLFEPVPEPTTLALLAAGIGVGAAALFRRRK